MATVIVDVVCMLMTLCKYYEQKSDFDVKSNRILHSAQLQNGIGVENEKIRYTWQMNRNDKEIGNNIASKRKEEQREREREL